MIYGELCRDGSQGTLLTCHCCDFLASACIASACLTARSKGGIMAYEACHDSLLGDSALLDQIRSVSFLIMSHHFSSFLIIFLIDILPRKKSPKSTEYLDESLVLGESTGAAASKLPRNFFSELHWLQLLRITESTPQDSMRAPCSHIIECVYIYTEYIQNIYRIYIYIRFFPLFSYPKLAPGWHLSFSSQQGAVPPQNSSGQLACDTSFAV